MTENKFPKKEFIILSVGEAICVLVTTLAFLGVSLLGISQFVFSYKVVTGALLGAVVMLLNFLFLSVSVNKAVDEYIALRGDKEMSDEDAEAFAAKNSMLIQNAVKKSFIVRVVSIAVSLVVAFLLDWFHPLATIVPILAYQPILTWGNHIYETAKKIIARVEKTRAEVSDAAEASEDAEKSMDSEPTEDAAEAMKDESIEPSEEILSNSEESGEELAEKSEDTEEEILDENEGAMPEENEENTEGSDINEL